MNFLHRPLKKTTMTSTKDPEKEDGQGDFKTAGNSIPSLSAVPLGLFEKRKCTNPAFFIFFTICFIFLVIMSVFFFKGIDLQKFIYGYDDCGNTCGVKNLYIKGLNCSGKDMRNRSVALIKYQKVNEECFFSKVRIVPDKCIERCKSPNELYFHRCYSPDDKLLDVNSKNIIQLTQVLDVLTNHLSVIVLLSFAGIVLTLILFMLLRCHVALSFWILTTFQFLTFVLITTYLWYKYSNEDSSLLYLFAALGTTSYLVFLFCFMIFFGNSFPLIFGLYEEAVIIISRMPIMLFLPLVTLAVIFFTVISLVFLGFFITANEYLKPTSTNLSVLEYVSNISVGGYACYIIFMLVWIYSLIDGYQTMVIAGAVSTYYFTRDKSNLQSPIYKNFLKMAHHFGTAASGSMIVTLMIFVRAAAEYIVNKAYIQTAMHGTPFFLSTLRGSRIICSNLVNALTLAGFNYIVINGFSFLAMLLTMLVGIWMSSECNYSLYTWMALTLGAFGACLVTLFMMSVISITTETLFFCYHEDQILNDGDFRPYFMSDRLKKIVEDSKENAMRHLNQS